MSSMCETTKFTKSALSLLLEILTHFRLLLNLFFFNQLVFVPGSILLCVHIISVCQKLNLRLRYMHKFIWVEIQIINDSWFFLSFFLTSRTVWKFILPWQLRMLWTCKWWIHWLWQTRRLKQHHAAIFYFVIFFHLFICVDSCLILIFTKITTWSSRRITALTGRTIISCYTQLLRLFKLKSSTYCIELLFSTAQIIFCKVLVMIVI